jgi:hypothetical protein
MNMPSEYGKKTGRFRPFRAVLRQIYAPFNNSLIATIPKDMILVSINIKNVLAGKNRYIRPLRQPRVNTRKIALCRLPDAQKEKRSRWGNLLRLFLGTDGLGETMRTRNF